MRTELQVLNMPLLLHGVAKATGTVWPHSQTARSDSVLVLFSMLQSNMTLITVQYMTILPPCFNASSCIEYFLTVHHIISIHAFSSDQICSSCIPSTHFLSFQHHKDISACLRQNYLHNHNYVAHMINSKAGWTCTHCRFDAICRKSAKHYRECFCSHCQLTFPPGWGFRSQRTSEMPDSKHRWANTRARLMYADVSWVLEETRSTITAHKRQKFSMTEERQ